MRKSRCIALTGMLLVILSLSLFHDSQALPIPPITILSHGEDSSVTSPIEMIANLDLNDGDFIRLSLIDDQQNTYARKLHRTQDISGESFEYRTSLAFEIPTESTQALLRLSIRDRFNRPVALRTVSLTLLKDGQSEIKPNTIQEPWLVIDAPHPGDVLSGGVVTVKGIVRPLTPGAVFFDLMTDSGGVIGGLQLAIDSPGERYEFEITIPYSFIYSQRDVRLIVRQRDARFDADVILDSVLILLQP